MEDNNDCSVDLFEIIKKIIDKTSNMYYHLRYQYDREEYYIKIFTIEIFYNNH